LACLGLVPGTKPASACSVSYLAFFEDGATEGVFRSRLMLDRFAREYLHRWPTDQRPTAGCGLAYADPKSDIFVRIEAHAQDSVGNACHLSRLRGEWMRDVLVAKGVPRDRIIVIAYGEARPMERGQRSPMNRYGQLLWYDAEDHKSILRRADGCAASPPNRSPFAPRPDPRYTPPPRPAAPPSPGG
jgi:hypothetical protein